MQQLDITANDAVRLQREVPATTEEANPLRQKFEIATSMGDPATQRTIEKATVGVLYTRPVKKPVFTTDGYPPWFDRLWRESDSSTYLQPLQQTSRLTQHRPGRYDEDRLKTKNYARDYHHSAAYGQGLATDDENCFLCRLNHEVILQRQQHSTGSQGDEHVLHLVQRDSRGYR